MKTTNKLMLIIATISILFIFIGSIMAWYYIETNDLTSTSLISTDNLHFYDNTELTFNGLFSSNARSSEYNTLIYNKNYTFDSAEKLFISITTEQIKFINEARDNIYIDYSLEYPNTPKYSNNFNCNLSNKKLIITSSQNVNNLLLDKIYSQTLTIHLPLNYKFSDITIENKSSLLQDNNLYYNTDNLYLISTYSDINITPNKPLNTLSIYGEFSELNLNIISPIKNLALNCDNGDINLISNSHINNCSIESDVGDINVEFFDFVNFLNFNTSLGNIYTVFHKYSPIIVSANSRFGDIDSDYLINNTFKQHYIFSSEFGDIEIIDNTTKGPNN